MKIFFDSNVYQGIVCPNNYTDDPNHDYYLKIHNEVLNGNIEAYLTEGIFTLEIIEKKYRQDKLGNTKAKITTQIRDTNVGVSLRITMGTNDFVSFDSNHILKQYYEGAIRLGFKIVRFPRMGAIKNTDIDETNDLYSPENWSAYYDKACEVSNYIENIGCGFSHIHDIGTSFNTTNIFRGIQQAPNTEYKKIAKALAEWVDGDAVAISVGLNCDYFCTLDQAKGAGEKSVFSSANINKS